MCNPEKICYPSLIFWAWQSRVEHDSSAPKDTIRILKFG